MFNKYKIENILMNKLLIALRDREKREGYTA